MNRHIAYIAITTLVAFVFSASALARTTQKGIVLLQNSGKTPLPGVQVMAFGAAPATSDGNGKFDLFFHGREEGRKLNVNEIYKKGYSVVNESSVKEWMISESSPVEIVMCRTEDLTKAQEKYYGIGRNYYRERYDAAVAKLEAEKRKRSLGEAEYLKGLEEAGREYAKALEKLDEYAFRIACMNTDEMTELERSVHSMIGRGDIAGALARLGNAGLEKRIAALSAMEKEEGEELEEMISSMQYYANICLFDGGTENLRKAKEIRREIALSDTSDFKYVFDYIETLVTVEPDREEVLKWIGTGIRNARDSQDSLMVFNYMLSTAIFINDNDEIVHWMKESRELTERIGVEKLMQEDRDMLLLQNTLVLNSLYILGHHEAVVGYFSECGKRFTDAVAKDPSSYAVLAGSAYSIYGLSLQSLSYHDECVKVQKRAREVLKEAKAGERVNALKSVADSYIAEAFSYLAKYDFLLADLYLEMAFKEIEKLRELNVYFANLSEPNYWYGYGLLKITTDKPSQAKKAFVNALDIIDGKLPFNHPSLKGNVIFILCSCCRDYLTDEEYEGYLREASDSYAGFKFCSYDQAIVYSNVNLMELSIGKKDYRTAAESFRRAVNHIHEADMYHKVEMSYVTRICSSAKVLYDKGCFDEEEASSLKDSLKEILGHLPDSKEKEKCIKKIRRL